MQIPDRDAHETPQARRSTEPPSARSKGEVRVGTRAARPAVRWTIAQPWVLLALRLVVGFGFMAHGVAKWQRGPEGFGRLLNQMGVPLPVVSAWAVTLVEVLGGLAILLGALVAVASVPLIVTMLVAMFTVHIPHGFSSVNTVGLTEAGPVFGPPGYEINLVYIAALLVLAVMGPGPFSANELLTRRRIK